MLACILLLWFQSRWHNPQKVVDMDPHIKDIFGFVPSILKPLYVVWLSFVHALAQVILSLHLCFGG